jgi:hypothetical protein
MNRRKFVGLFGGLTAAASAPASLLQVFGEGQQTALPDSDASRMPEHLNGERCFPNMDYTPFGYLDNPNHSAVLNRSGILRSVPPLGFGYWTRVMPWPYGDGTLRRVNYLSFLHLSMVIDGVCLHQIEDFDRHGVKLSSRYHTKNMMSYDWEFSDLASQIQYVYKSENSQTSTELQLTCKDALLALVRVINRDKSQRTVTIHATNIYGYPQEEWWGSDGVAAEFDDKTGTALSKIWAYGDIFALCSDRKSRAHKATCNEKTWNDWVRTGDLSSNTGASSSFPGAIYTVMSYSMSVPPGGEESIAIALARSVNREAAADEAHRALSGAIPILQTRLADDDRFYRATPLLTGDWSDHWKRGWIYDIETLRMTIRPALGIYKHPWDGMQMFTPRAVLGETLLDSLSISYCDVALAKDVILGIFADSQAPNLPCSREDGSVNMICSDGSEVGTAPTWGMPFHVIRSICLRDGDAEWIRMLYPHMAAFLDWWLGSRTDGDGWFHCKCSWESGQDGSKRFIVAEGNPAAVADFVRTADIEAAMADAFRSMILFSEVAGEQKDREKWKRLAERRIETTRSMCVDGWFRDFDARTNKPIILRDYYDVMMLYPIAAGVATEEQMRAIAPRFKYFTDNPKFWLEWPSFMLPFSEAAWNSGQRDLLASVLVGTANRVYARTDARQTKLVSIDPAWPEEDKRLFRSFPERYRYRAPGIANEYWPLDENDPGGCEGYGWGATLPALIIRNIIGFREDLDLEKMEFSLAPSFPAEMITVGKTYGITNLAFRGTVNDVEYLVGTDSTIQIMVRSRSVSGKLPIRAKDENGKTLAAFTRHENEASCQVTIKQGTRCVISFE